MKINFLSRISEFDIIYVFLILRKFTVKTECSIKAVCLYSNLLRRDRTINKMMLAALQKKKKEKNHAFRPSR